MWFSAKANRNERTSNTIIVGLRLMENGTPFTPQLWRNYGKKRKTDLQRDQLDGIKAEARYVTLNDVFALWAQVKRGLKDNTYQNHLYLYRQFVEPDFGKSRVSALKKIGCQTFL